MTTDIKSSEQVMLTNEFSRKKYEKFQLVENVNDAKEALKVAEKALAKFTDSIENNVFASLKEARIALESRLLELASGACKERGCLGDDIYTQEFIVDGKHYTLTGKFEYDSYGEIHYYVDSYEFNIKPK